MTAGDLSYDELQEFAIRPFVLIVSLDAPILERFRRKTRYCIYSLELRRSEKRVLIPCFFI